MVRLKIVVINYIMHKQLNEKSLLLILATHQTPLIKYFFGSN